MTDLTLAQTRAERGAGWVYWWLLASPLITVPCMVINFPYNDDTAAWRWMVATILPLIFHVILLIGVLSPYRYVSRHALQSVVLILLRTLSSMFFIGLFQGWGVFFWLVINGGLWLVGTIMGLYQTRHGYCGLMYFLGEGGELPRPWAKKGFTATAASPSVQPAPLAPVVIGPAPATIASIEPVVSPPPKVAPVVAEPAPAIVASKKSVASSPPLVVVPASASPVKPSPTKSVPAPLTSTLTPDPSQPDLQTFLLRGRTLAQSGDRKNAIEYFLMVFRKGPPLLKKKAVEELRRMGEVGEF